MDINKSRKGISVCASANEVDEAVRQERHKWKIFRIQQVREQARQEARRIRESVRDKELQMVRDLRQELNDQWQAEKENEVQQLQQEYKESLEALGEAHEVAKQQPNASEVLNQLARCNQQKAKRRGQEAQKVQTDQQLQQQHEKTKLLKQRQDVLNREKLRANLIANLPTPEAFKKKTYVVEKKTPAVQFHEAGTFTTTTYVPKNVIIEKEVNSTKPNAKQAAVVEEMAQAVLAEAKCKAAEEEDRKREKRGNEALSRERLRRMYQQLMRQLDQAQRDHQLSSYLKGADSLSIYETEETRLKHHAKLQRLMEKAVGKVLQEEDALQAEDVSSDDTQPAVESSGLSEVTDTSSVMSAQKTSSKKVKDLKSLLDQIKKRRNEILQGVYSSVPEEEEASEKEVIDEAEDKYMRQYTRQEEVESDAQYLQTQITAQDDDDGGMTPNGEDHQQQDQQYGGSKRRGEEKDIHMAATIPVHLLPGTHDGKSICTSKRIVTELPSTKSSLEKSGSDDIERQVNIDEDVSTVGAQTSADEYSRLPSPIVYSLPRDKDLVSSISSGTSSTDYLCPPSSLPFRIPLAKKTMDSLRETQPQRQYVSSRPISKEHEDIHLADTVPVHLLPTHHYNGSTDSSQRFASQLSTLSSNQESSSDDIEIKIKIRGDGSTLKTITPSEDEVPEPVSFIADHEHPMEYSYSGTSSTEYISPPSSLPARNIQTSQLNENLRKIQQQRHKIQHIIDSKSDRSTRQTSLQKSISPSVYYEKLKGEGIGKRPLKKKEKFEMQKKEVLNYYMKKLLQMKGGELKNISASTVEGSGFNVSSLSSFLESLQREKGPSVFNTSSSDSPLSSAHESSIDSNSFSSYYDIDEIPVKLSSHSSSDSIYSYDKGTDTHSNPSERYRIQQSSALTQSYDDESRKPEHPVYSQSNASLNSNIAKPFPHSSVSLGSQSDESNSGIISGGPTDLRRELQVLDSIKNLEQLKKELMNLQHQVFEENLSATKPDSSNSSLSNRSEATYPTVSSDVRQPRKVTFG
ncbi:Centrosomal protein of 295 kDa-like [Homarus americanus]|uniref:Centrosomal protein of 295 kDa-like n=2 Tax=Homarus americanus TaxID=6706 RepID=A0A8J5TTQ9_HOMAM|nr:Centrosomal protein of 295 kDa-like [Homarus americanus]